MGTLLHSCVKVREVIELLIGMMSGVGPSVVVLDGVHNPNEKRRFWEGEGWCRFVSTSEKRI